MNAHHQNPTDMDVVVIPAGYFSSSAYTANTGWIGPNALLTAPGTQAVLEAIDYWVWTIDQYQGTNPQLAHLTWETTVLGVNAGLDDLNDAEIIVTTAMVGDPSMFMFHLGLGLPTHPIQSFTNSGGSPMQVCTTWNTGLGSEGNTMESLFFQGPADRDPLRLRNLAIHEFGHCLATGHTGGETTCSIGGSQVAAVRNAENVCYGAPNAGALNEDVMSSVHGKTRQCLSNLNIQSLAEAYAWLPGGWQAHDDETYMPKSAYQQTCMPSSLNRF